MHDMSCIYQEDIVNMWRMKMAMSTSNTPRYSDDDSPTGDKDSKFYTKDTCVAIVTQLSNNDNNWFTGFVWK